LIKTLLRKPY